MRASPFLCTNVECELYCVLCVEFFACNTAVAPKKMKNRRSAFATSSQSADRPSTRRVATPHGQRGRARASA